MYGTRPDDPFGCEESIQTGPLMTLLEGSEGKGEEERRLRNYARKHFRTASQLTKYDRFRFGIMAGFC